MTAEQHVLHGTPSTRAAVAKSPAPDLHDMNRLRPYLTLVRRADAVDTGVFHGYRRRTHGRRCRAAQVRILTVVDGRVDPVRASRARRHRTTRSYPGRQ